MMKEKEDLLVQALKVDNVDALNVLNAKAERIKAELGLEEARISAGQTSQIAGRAVLRKAAVTTQATRRSISPDFTSITGPIDGE